MHEYTAAGDTHTHSHTRIKYTHKHMQLYTQDTQGCIQMTCICTHTHTHTHTHVYSGPRAHGRLCVLICDDVNKQRRDRGWKGKKRATQRETRKEKQRITTTTRHCDGKCVSHTHTHTLQPWWTEKRPEDRYETERGGQEPEVWSCQM